MNFFNLFKKKKIEPEKRKQIGKGVFTTLYPDRILVCAQDQTSIGYWISTERICILPVDVTDEILGSTVFNHLQLSRNYQPPPSDFAIFHKSWLKAAGFKTAKSQYLNAKDLSVYLENEKITISPSLNGGSTGKNRGFSYIGESTLVRVDAGDEEIGKQIRKCWTLCK